MTAIMEQTQGHDMGAASIAYACTASCVLILAFTTSNIFIQIPSIFFLKGRFFTPLYRLWENRKNRLMARQGIFKKHDKKSIMCYYKAEKHNRRKMDTGSVDMGAVRLTECDINVFDNEKLPKEIMFAFEFL